jgi:hypothetical protein
MSSILRSGACVLMLLATASHAQAPEDPAVFAGRLVTAINTKDPERRKELAHPASLRCLNGPDRTFFEETFARQATPAIPPTYRARMQARTPTQPLPFEDKVEYPIRPTHELQIDFETGPHRSKTLMLQAVSDGKQWREVWACPKPEMRRQMLEASEAKARQKEKVKALAAGMAQPLRAQVLALGREGKKIEAIQHYRTASGEDLSVAREVVELLLSPVRPAE